MLVSTIARAGRGSGRVLLSNALQREMVSHAGDERRDVGGSVCYEEANLPPLSCEAVLQTTAAGLEQRLMERWEYSAFTEVAWCATTGRVAERTAGVLSDLDAQTVW